MLRQRVTSAADRSVAAQLVTAGGYVTAALMLTGVTLYGTIPIQHLFNDAALPTPAVSRALLGAGYATGLVVAPLAFGLMIVAVSLLGLRHSTLPRWLALAGFPPPPSSSPACCSSRLAERALEPDHRRDTHRSHHAACRP